MSFADRRISNGRGYESIGFKLLSTTQPNYFYSRGGVTISRHRAMKHKLLELLGDKFDPNKTERQNMENSGWHFVADSGNHKLVYEPD